MSDSESAGSDTRKRKGENYDIFQKSKKPQDHPLSL